MEVESANKDIVKITISRSDLAKIMSMSTAVVEQFEALDPHILELSLEDAERLSDDLLSAVKVSNSLNR